MTSSPYTSIKRREDKRLLLGRARFVDDVHLDHMVHGVFIRSPHPHARIKSIDSRVAIASGALLVLTSADLPFLDRPWITRYWHPSIRSGLPNFLVTDKVRFVGDPVAFLVANDRYQAEDLAALVDVDYEPLPAIATMDDAVADGAHRLHDTWTGNIAAEFAHTSDAAPRAMDEAHFRVRRSFRSGRQSPVALEPRGVLADWDIERDALTVWMSTQAHYNVRQNLATILGLPEYQVRVQAEDVGGGFGAKSRTYAEELIVSHASRCLRRPVKWIEDRFENLQATTHSRAIDVDIELGCDADGRFVALNADIKLDVGGYVFTSGIMTAEVAAANLTNVYRIPQWSINVRCIGTNKTPIATYRGAGQPEAIFPIECVVDLLAKTVGISATEIRRRNMVTPSDFPYSTGRALAGFDMIFESGDFPKLMDLAVDRSGYDEAVETLPDGRRVAWGIASSVEGSGFVNFETANIKIDLNGKVTVLSGMTTQGQGQLTTYAQVCAETLGVDVDDVRVRLGDTQLVPFGRGAFASRGAVFGANAVFLAAQQMKAKALRYAGILLQISPDELAVRDGQIVRAGAETATGLTLASVAREVMPGGSLFDGAAALEVEYVYKGDQPVTFGSSTHVARVSLDIRTGLFDVIDYLVAHDAGLALNPMIVEGQIVGGAVDGIGGALFSEIVYDESGQLLTGSLADYMVATSADVPRIRLAEMETRSTTNPLGVRGIGEGGIIPCGAAIANALARAIDPNGIGHEVELFALPLKPERVFKACQAGRVKLKSRAY